MQPKTLEAPRHAVPAAVAALALTLFAAMPALGADASKAGASEAVFLCQIIALLLTGRLLGELMQRVGQPAVLGQLIAGLILGPSVLGALWPEAQQALFPAVGEQKSMINAISQIGVLMLLLLTGMETDVTLVRRAGRAALSVSFTGIAIPFACGFLLGEMLPDSALPHPEQRLITSLFLGTALSISSVKIVAMVIREMNFMRRNLGQIIVASAIIDDTIGWVIIAVTFGLAQHGTVDFRSVVTSVAGTLLFLLVSFALVRPLVINLIRWANDSFISDVPVLTAILVVMAAMALATHAIGVHTVLGAFVAGILVGQSPILTRQIDDQLRGLIVAFFMPVFFGMAGLSANLTILADPRILALTLGLIAIASVGKFAGAFAGGWLGGLNRPESLAIACGINARGSTEVIVATIGLSMGALSQDLFTMIVTMAVVTTMAMPPMLRAALRRLPLREEERLRLEREAIAAKGFVTRLERLLLAVDDSAKGRFAARVTGLLAAQRGAPVTVLHVPNAGRTPPLKPAGQPGVEAVVKSNAELARQRHDGPTRPVHVQTRQRDGAIAEAVQREARHGYDLALVGLEPTVAPEGGFHDRVAQAADSFPGPLAIVAARGMHMTDPLDAELRILVPITGTEISRRGAEVAIMLARASDAQIVALYVASGIDKRARQYGFGGSRRGESILKDIVGLGEQHGVVVKTMIRADTSPEDAILRQARLGGHNLIVMGVTRRPALTLTFGKVASAVLDSSDRSLLYVVS
jgi:Kef-type K+ transport system membrane component KefB/nucleotide-binding universal stress UspA family protein